MFNEAKHFPVNIRIGLPVEMLLAVDFLAPVPEVDDMPGAFQVTSAADTSTNKVSNNAIGQCWDIFVALTDLPGRLLSKYLLHIASKLGMGLCP